MICVWWKYGWLVKYDSEPWKSFWLHTYAIHIHMQSEGEAWWSAVSHVDHLDYQKRANCGWGHMHACRSFSSKFKFETTSSTVAYGFTRGALNPLAPAERALGKYTLDPLPCGFQFFNQPWNSDMSSVAGFLANKSLSEMRLSSPSQRKKDHRVVWCKKAHWKNSQSKAAHSRHESILPCLLVVVNAVFSTKPTNSSHRSLMATYDAFQTYYQPDLLSSHSLSTI